MWFECKFPVLLLQGGFGYAVTAPAL